MLVSLSFAIIIQLSELENNKHQISVRVEQFLEVLEASIGEPIDQYYARISDSQMSKRNNCGSARQWKNYQKL